MKEEVFSVDGIINTLLAVRGKKPGKNVDLEEKDIKKLCQRALIIFKEQPMLIELEAPLKVCGKY